MFAVRGLAPTCNLAARPGLGLAIGTVLPERLHFDALCCDRRGPKLVKRYKDLIKTWKIKKGDEVVINSGKDKGSSGEVLMTDFRRNMVKVKGVNLRKMQDEEGNMFFIEKKVHYSNCALIDPVHRKPTKVGLTFTEGGDAIRVSKLSGRVIPWPDRLTTETEPQKWEDGPKDTPPEKALEKTYDYKADNEAIRLARLAMTKYNYTN
eukprot:TRINITY_DN33275_c0_g1_i1.p1 TRINITY_DN33275_c0_g1~~TRINITY_DN33275_c0_g1_i1.p1  ORF type:complete len:207 (-),score=50.95 TRINITY_DN33275_c0_g1_i1:70-690(-)